MMVVAAIVLGVTGAPDSAEPEQVASLLRRAADAGTAATAPARRETWLTTQLLALANEFEQGSGEDDPVGAAAAAVILGKTATITRTRSRPDH